MSFHDTHPHLVQYVESMNVWRGLMREPTIKLAFFSREDRAAVRKKLECDLSPENLTCDGELCGDALAKRTQYLANVQRELETFK